MKPFSFAELLARLRALVRRGAVERPARARRSATSASTRRRARCGAATRRSPCRRRSSRCSRSSCASRARCCRASSCSSTPGTTSTRTARTSSTSTCATCARRSTGRSAVTSIETVRGAGYRLRAGRRRALLIRRLPIRLRVDARVRGRDGGPAGASPASSSTCASQSDLDESINHGLRVARRRRQRADRSSATAGLTRRAQRPRRGGESFAQVLDARGAVLDATPAAAGRAAADAERARAARARDASFLDPVQAARARRAGARCSRRRCRRGGRRLVVVVGAVADDRDDALASLALLLAIGGPVALLLASLAGYGVASAALRPVEAMRRKAERDHRATSPGERLPVAAARRRDRAARDDAQRHARAPRARRRARARVRRRRQPRAAHAAGDPQDRARARAARRRATAEELRGRAALGRRGDRPPRRARRGPARDRARRRRRAAAQRGARRRAPSCSTRGRRALRARVRAERARARRRCASAACTVDGRPRCGSSRRSTTSSTTRCATAPATITRARGARRHVELHVRDEGPGFPAAVHRRGVRALHPRRPARGRGGSGLGLAIVQTIARAHGGDARAANDPDGGARVTIELPPAQHPSSSPAGPARLTR